jgi:nicotinamide-nucleotide amidase
VVVRRTLRVVGLSESEVDRRLAGLARPDGNPCLGLSCGLGEVLVHLTASGRPETASWALRRLARRVRRGLGSACYGRGAIPLEAEVGRRLRAAGLTLATAESLTGGLLASRITDVPGSSDYFLGGFVAYRDGMKGEELGVEEGLLAARGAVSAEVALAMARGARLRARASLGLALTGIAGPGGGSRKSPVGLTFIALAAPSPRVARHVFAGDRLQVKRLATQKGLELLYRHLVEQAARVRARSPGRARRSADGA